MKLNKAIFFVFVFGLSHYVVSGQNMNSLQELINIHEFYKESNMPRKIEVHIESEMKNDKYTDTKENSLLFYDDKSINYFTDDFEFYIDSTAVLLVNNIERDMIYSENPEKNFLCGIYLITKTSPDSLIKDGKYHVQSTSNSITIFRHNTIDEDTGLYIKYTYSDTYSLQTVEYNYPENNPIKHTKVQILTDTFNYEEDYPLQPAEILSKYVQGSQVVGKYQGYQFITNGGASR